MSKLRNGKQYVINIFNSFNLCLRIRTHSHAAPEKAIGGNTLHEGEENTEKDRKTFPNMHHNLNTVSSKLFNYFEVQMFANSLKENDRVASEASLQSRCNDRYSRCELKTSVMP